MVLKSITMNGVTTYIQERFIEEEGETTHLRAWMNPYGAEIVVIRVEKDGLKQSTLLLTRDQMDALRDMLQFLY